MHSDAPRITFAISEFDLQCVNDHSAGFRHEDPISIRLRREWGRRGARPPMARQERGRGAGRPARFADALGVPDSQCARWIRGEDSPNAENARAIVDLEYVVARARLLWSDDETVNLWLNGRNAFLGGARPIDVIMTRGVSPVVDALDQEMAGAFA